MFNTIRNWFNKPRLTLMQRWNVATLLTLLEDLPAENYIHTTFGDFANPQRFIASGGGCGVGLARSHRTKFYVPHSNPLLAKLGIPVRHHAERWFNRDDAFGSAAYATVFHTSAFYAAGHDGYDVTKKMVIDRLKAYAYEGYRA